MLIGNLCHVIQYVVMLYNRPIDGMLIINKLFINNFLTGGFINLQEVLVVQYLQAVPVYLVVPAYTN